MHNERMRVHMYRMRIANAMRRGLVRWTRRVTDLHSDYTQSGSRKSEVGSFVENSILTNAHFEIIPGMATLARCDWEPGK